MLFKAFGMALGALFLETGVAIALVLGVAVGAVLLIAGLTHLKGAQTDPDSRKNYRVISIIGAVLLVGTLIGLLMLRLTSSL